MNTYILERPRNSTPKFYSTEEISSEHKIVYERYFMPGTDIDYFVLEYCKDDDIIFCWAELVSGCGELGYSSLKEMERVYKTVAITTPYGSLFLIVHIERDQNWTPITLGEALENRLRRL